NNQEASDDCEQRRKCPVEHNIFGLRGHPYAHRCKQHGIDNRNTGPKNTKPYVLRGAWPAPRPLTADWPLVERRRIVPDGRHLLLNIHCNWVTTQRTPPPLMRRTRSDARGKRFILRNSIFRSTAVRSTARRHISWRDLG